jgi:hypothetical protein
VSTTSGWISAPKATVLTSACTAIGGGEREDADADGVDGDHPDVVGLEAHEAAEALAGGGALVGAAAEQGRGGGRGLGEHPEHRGVAVREAEQGGEGVGVDPGARLVGSGAADLDLGAEPRVEEQPGGLLIGERGQAGGEGAVLVAELDQLGWGGLKGGDAQAEVFTGVGEARDPGGGEGLGVLAGGVDQGGGDGVGQRLAAGAAREGEEEAEEGLRALGGEFRRHLRVRRYDRGGRLSTEKDDATQIIVRRYLGKTEVWSGPWSG